METDRISVVIPNYNRAHLITKTIDSVLTELIDGDEVIVIDDGSTDNSDEVIKPYLDRIKYVKIKNSGAGAARNKGIGLAVNPLIAFLDSDDLWMPGKLHLQRTLMQKRPDILFCFSDIASLKPDGILYHNRLISWHKDYRKWDEILGPGEYFSTIGELPIDIDDFKFYVGDLYKGLLHSGYVNTGTLVVRRQEAGEALRFGLDVPLYEDWECFGLLARTGKAAYLEQETLIQNVHEYDRLTKTDEITCADTRIEIINRVWGADEEFIRNHSDLLKQVISGQRLRKATALIKLGKTGEARNILKNVIKVPLPHRIISRLPGPVVKVLMRLRGSE